MTSSILRPPAISDIIFQDLIIDGALTNNDSITALVYLSGAQSHIRFQRLEVKNSWYSGVNDYTNDTDGTVRGGSNEWLDCSFHHNGRRPDGLYGGGGNSGQGYYGKASNALIDHCNVYNNHGYGLGINFDNNIVRNCTIHDNGGTLWERSDTRYELRDLHWKCRLPALQQQPDLQQPD